MDAERKEMEHVTKISGATMMSRCPDCEITHESDQCAHPYVLALISTRSPTAPWYRTGYYAGLAVNSEPTTTTWGFLYLGLNLKEARTKFHLIKEDRRQLWVNMMLNCYLDPAVGPIKEIIEIRKETGNGNSVP